MLISIALLGGLPFDANPYLSRLVAIQRGKKTDFAALEKLGDQLLSETSTEAQQAQVYSALAIVYSQTGMKRPDKVREFGSRALTIGVAPSVACQLHVYMGDSHRAEAKETKLPAQYEEAGRSYCRGLKQLEALNIPDEPPSTPAIDPLADADESIAVMERIRYQQGLVSLRNVVLDHIAEFDRFFDGQRLEVIAAEELGDGRDLVELRKRLAIYRQRFKGIEESRVIKQQSQEQKKLPTPVPKRWKFATIVTGNLFVLIAIFAVFWSRRNK